MLDETNKILYLDYSTLANFRLCKEKTRLGNVIGYRPVKVKESLAFGHAFHAGIAAYYDALAGGSYDSARNWHPFATGSVINPVLESKTAFLRDLRIEGNELPVDADSDERRSIERGLAMLEAYFYRYKAEPYDNVIIDGKPLTEVGFRYYVTSVDGYEVWYVGYIDRIMRNRSTGRPVIFETKTTTQGLSYYIFQVKPNHQITGYYKPARELVGEDLMECVWDCAFISNRKPDLKKAATEDDGRFWMAGVDSKNDFKRQITARSNTDISEFMIDVEMGALEYYRWLTSGTARWERSAPQACHTYGGCMFRNVCIHNANVQILGSDFHIKKWEPWRAIMASEIKERDSLI